MLLIQISANISSILRRPTFHIDWSTLRRGWPLATPDAGSSNLASEPRNSIDKAFYMDGAAQPCPDPCAAAGRINMAIRATFCCGASCGILDNYGHSECGLPDDEGEWSNFLRNLVSILVQHYYCTWTFLLKETTSIHGVYIGLSR